MQEDSKHKVGQSLDEIQKAKSPMALIAATSNLVKTLVDAHHEHFKGETVTVNKAEYERTRKLANAAVDFSAATMERVCKAMDQLEEARELGRAVLAPLQS